MGLYTEYHFRFPLVRNLDRDIARFLIHYQVDDPPPCDHPFFNTRRWYFIISGIGLWHNTQYGNLWIVTDGEVKNYDEEIIKFLLWICPYIKTRSGRKSKNFLGWSMQEWYGQPWRHQTKYHLASGQVREVL